MTRLTHVQGTDKEAERLQSAMTRLQRLLKACEGFAQEVVEPPKEGSAIHTAYRTGQRDAFDIASQLLFAAEDHLRTILMVAEKGPLPCFALFTLLRAAADALVRAKYLLDPTITPSQRLGRALNARLDNLREQRRAASAVMRARRLTVQERLAIAAEDDRHLEERTALLESHAKNAGLTIHRTKGKITGFGEVKKTARQLFTEMLPAGSVLFSFLSGYVHSMSWVEFLGHRARPSDDPGVVLVPTDLNLNLFVDVLTAIMNLHDDTRGHWVVLAGYPIDVWRLARGDS